MWKDIYMTENERNLYRRPDKISMSLCYRIERLCGQIPLKIKDERSMKDRRIVEDFYCFYREQGCDHGIAMKNAKANAIRVILTEELT